jgi:hypothetical protein
MTTGSAQRRATVRSVPRDLSSLEAANQGPVLSESQILRVEYRTGCLN